jgi:hypothetical protein
LIVGVALQNMTFENNKESPTWKFQKFPNKRIKPKNDDPNKKMDKDLEGLS